MTILCNNPIEYFHTKCDLLNKGYFFIGSNEPTQGKSYLQVDETSFKQITKKDYENYQQ
jgi:hypothetical protein